MALFEAIARQNEVDPGSMKTEVTEVTGVTFRKSLGKSGYQKPDFEVTEVTKLESLEKSPFLPVSSESVRQDLFTLYAQIGQHSKADLARWEAERPGFKATWQRIEHAFSSAWQCGQDCGLEVEALRRLFGEVVHVAK